MQSLVAEYEKLLPWVRSIVYPFKNSARDPDTIPFKGTLNCEAVLVLVKYPKLAGAEKDQDLLNLTLVSKYHKHSNIITLQLIAVTQRLPCPSFATQFVGSYWNYYVVTIMINHRSIDTITHPFMWTYHIGFPNSHSKPWWIIYSHGQPKSAYYLVQTIPFLGISKVARKFPNCRNHKLIKCRGDWHEQISLNWCFNGFWPQNFGQPPNSSGEILKYVQLTPFCKPIKILFRKNNFYKLFWR